MNYYSTNKIRKAFINTTKNPKFQKQILAFYSDMNIFDKLNVENLYLPKGTDEVHISQDDFEKIILLGSIKLERGFKVKRVGVSNPDIYKEMEHFKVNNLIDVKRAISKKMKDGNSIRVLDRLKKSRLALKEKHIREMPEDIEQKRIVSIDFEFSHKKSLITEMGMTVKQGDNTISKHYLIDTAYQTKSNSSLQKRFRYGETEIISLDKMTDIIKSQLSIADYALFHSHQEDIKLFNIHGIWLDDYNQLKILDTQTFHGKQRPLHELLTQYEITHAKSEMHNSGNDAYYTVKLLEKLNNKPKSEVTIDIMPAVENKAKPKMSFKT